MRMSPRGVALLKEFEGCDLEPYRCSAGKWTIGYGWTRDIKIEGQIFHTIADAVGSKGDKWKISVDQAEELLNIGLIEYERGVLLALDVPVEQHEFDALVSLTYNIGVEAFRRSTVRRRLRVGNRAGAAEAITWWNKETVDGVKRVSKGLKRRREAERDLFLGLR